MGPICCPETSIRDYHYTLRNTAGVIYSAMEACNHVTLSILGWTVRGSDSGRSRRSFPKRSNRLWGPPSLLFNGYRRSLRKINMSRFVADHSTPSIADNKNEWIYNSTPPICLHGVDRGNFTFFIVPPQLDVPFGDVEYIPRNIWNLFNGLLSCYIHGFSDSGYRAV